MRHTPHDAPASQYASGGAIGGGDGGGDGGSGGGSIGGGMNGGAGGGGEMVAYATTYTLRESQLFAVVLRPHASDSAMHRSPTSVALEHASTEPLVLP